MSLKEFDVYAENCPSRKVLDIISNKWTILIIKKISEKTYRFGELNREIGGISKKVLTQTLRLLEHNGFILRQEYDELPLRVEYSLTELGVELSRICETITHWAENNLEKIKLAQQKNDKLKCIS